MVTADCTNSFNLPNYDWVDGSGFSAEEQESPFLTCLYEHLLFQTVDQPTQCRDGQICNILDLIILNNPDLWTKNEFLTPIGNCDHAAILTELCLATAQPLPKHTKLLISSISLRDWLTLIGIPYSLQTSKNFGRNSKPFC